MRLANYIRDTNDRRMQSQVKILHNIVTHGEQIDDATVIDIQRKFYSLWGIDYANKVADQKTGLVIGLDSEAQDDDEDGSGTVDLDLDIQTVRN